LPQFKIHVAQPNITENDAKAMYDAVRSNFLGPGPIVEQFEKEVAANVKGVVITSSGSFIGRALRANFG